VNNTNLPLKQHLKSKGIKNYNQFENHLQKVEDKFWNKTFMKYNKWKESHYEKYKKIGYVDSLTGFRCSGVMSKNQVTNYPVQGVAFHCLLWSLIQIHNTLKRENWKTKIIGQIHDELIADVHPDEKDDYLQLVKKVMCHDIREHWPWIITTLDIEATSTPIDGNWHLKKEIHIPEFIVRSK
jgi:DNA polymerase I-like protein with 3'-5' exonuclease and polymerase domains